MFHIPAHKNTVNKASQASIPAVRTLGDYIKAMESLEEPLAAREPIDALRRLEIAAENFRRQVSRAEVDPTDAGRGKAISRAYLEDALRDARQTLAAAAKTNLRAA